MVTGDGRRVDREQAGESWMEARCRQPAAVQDVAGLGASQGRRRRERCARRGGEAARRRGQQLVQWEGCKVQGARCKEQGARCVSGRWHDDRADRYGWRRIEWRRGVDADD
jgi:hypothetical protein